MRTKLLHEFQMLGAHYVCRELGGFRRVRFQCCASNLFRTTYFMQKIVIKTRIIPMSLLVAIFPRDPLDFRQVKSVRRR